MTLYEITSSILNAVSQMTDDGELAPGVEEQLAGLEMAMTEKVDNVAAFIRTCEAEAIAYKAETDRLGNLAAVATRKAERLKAYLKEELQRAGMTRIDGPRFKVSVQRNGTPTVKLAEGAAVPERFARVKTELDSRAVMEAVKAGEEIPDTLTVYYGQHLRMR